MNLEEIGIEDNFFTIGGDSIRAIRLVNAVNKEFSIHLEIADLYANRTVETLSRQLGRERNRQHESALEDARNEIESLEQTIIAENKLPVDQVSDIYPMSDIQKGMVYHSLQDPGEALYHDQFVYQLSYPHFDSKKLKKAMAFMVEKHPILRTAFDLTQFSSEVQIVYRYISIDIPHRDISNMANDQQENHLKQWMITNRQVAFDIRFPPLWSMNTFTLDPANIVLVWTFHHAILDGWSSASFIVELNDIYVKLMASNGAGIKPVPLKSSYKDFIIHQSVEKKKSENIQFWKKELDGYKRLEFTPISP
ncbi:MAG: hypothetical protein GY940_25220, partial [bacterium]|nr:hypothetical protein [bacterium]